MENKKLIGWIAGGVVLAAVVIYFLVSGGISLPEAGPPTPATPEEVGPAAVQTEQGIVGAPGLSPVSEETGEVVTKTGAPVRQDVTPGSPEAPQQSSPLAPANIPRNAVKLSISAAGFSPGEFKAKAGEAVTLSLTSTDGFTHVFAFNDPELEAVAIGVGPGETRAISFNAPTKTGDYPFQDNVPGHAARGEVGKMVVE